MLWFWLVAKTQTIFVNCLHYSAFLLTGCAFLFPQNLHKKLHFTHHYCIPLNSKNFDVSQATLNLHLQKRLADRKTCSHLDDAAGNLESRVEANLQRSFGKKDHLQTKPRRQTMQDWHCKKRHLHEPAKQGRVVISDCLCIAECLEDRVGLEDLLLHPR